MRKCKESLGLKQSRAEEASHFQFGHIFSRRPRRLEDMILIGLLCTGGSRGGGGGAATHLMLATFALNQRLSAD